MAKLNTHYSKLSESELSSKIEKRISKRSSSMELIDLAKNDADYPLLPAIIQALQAATLEMGRKDTFRSYGPSTGYPFLKEAIAKHDYQGLVDSSEIFISDGATSDLADIQEIFCASNRVALPDPVHPVHLNTTVLAGRTRLQLKNGRFGGILYLPCTEASHFCPEPPIETADLVYLCSPNPFTACGMNRELLKHWIHYAKMRKAVIFFDGSYEAYISSADIPKSIYEIDGAKEVAIEIRSFSKTAGFGGLRLSYTVVPHTLKIFDCGQENKLHTLWQKRCNAKYAGAPYIIQKGAEAIYSPEGKTQVKERVDFYKKNSNQLLSGLKQLGFRVYGGIDAPYIWCKTTKNMTSWQFFDLLLNQAGIVSLPGSELGLLGEKFVRFSAFVDPSQIKEALRRLECVAQ